LKRIILATALLGALAVPGVAHAEWYFTKQGAERVTRDAVAKRYAAYGLTRANTVAACTPQGGGYDRRFKYHRWRCDWAHRAADGQVCAGTLLIIGSNSPGAYYHQVIHGGRCST
jgi:hypothetical protein